MYNKRSRIWRKIKREEEPWHEFEMIEESVVVVVYLFEEEEEEYLNEEEKKNERY